MHSPDLVFCMTNEGEGELCTFIRVGEQREDVSDQQLREQALPNGVPRNLGPGFVLQNHVSNAK